MRPSEPCLLSLLVAMSLGCGAGRGVVTLGEVEFRSETGAGEPNLALASDGSVILTWHEGNREDGYALRLSERRDGRWSSPQTIAQGLPFFVNWADFPSLVEHADGSWLVHWLQKTAESTYAYHVRISRSTDRGVTWSEPVVAHRDGSPTEHGFVSMAALNGTTGVLWLDGRETPSGDEESPGPMTLRFTDVTSPLELGADVLVDDRVCDCCQTSMVATSSGLVAAYRDRSDAEIRDIAVKRWDGSTWSDPVYPGDDGWYYPGCPVNGPDLAARGDTVAVVWYSAPEQRPLVQVAFSVDGARTFGPPLRIDDGFPLGRVAVALVDANTAAAFWLESRDDDAAIVSRVVSSTGAMGPVTDLTPTSPSRASGFPIVVRAGEELLLAWTEAGEAGGVRVASAAIVN
ncbi:MAG: sialidase family protein [Gemmatimonadales bacterium]